MTQKAKRKKSTIILAFIAPIIAIFISYSMLTDYISKKGNTIILYAKNIKDLEVKQSHVEYRGLKIGAIKNIEIDKNNANRFKITAQIYKQYNYFIKQGSKFWIVSPKININKIENLRTVLTGNYIQMSPPTNDIEKLKTIANETTFNLLPHKPYTDGSILVLNCDNSNIVKGSLVKYKDVIIGEVISKELLDKNTITYKIVIYEKYKYLISKDTYFYEKKPLDLELSPTKLSLKVSSIDDILKSSLSILIDDSINNKANTKIYKNKTYLYLNNKVIKIKIKSNQNIVNIYFNNEVVGLVQKSKFDEKTNTKLLYVKFKDKYFYLLKTDPKFYFKKNNLDIENINLKDMISDPKLIMKNSFNIKTDIKELYVIDDFNTSLYTNAIKIKIQSDNLYKNEQIFYKGIDIGVITSVYLDKDDKNANAIIYNKYKYLINDSTQFYKLKDINIDISTSGLKVNIGSIKQLYKGGISFVTSDLSRKLSNPRFSLFNSISDLKIYNNNKHSFSITILADNLYNIKKSSKLFYKNIIIGNITKIKYPNISNNNKLPINIIINIDNIYKKLFDTNSKIYLEGIILSFNKVKNIGTALTGDKLVLVTKEETNLNTKRIKYKSLFKIDSFNPVKTKYQGGLRVILSNKTAQDITLGSPVYYHNFQIGSIEDMILNTKTSNIDITVFIQKRYIKYIKNNSKFTKATVVDIDLGLLSSKIKIGNIDTLLKGGINVTSPTKFKKYAKTGDKYKLFIQKN